jgi:hypothetical protein
MAIKGEPKFVMTRLGILRQCMMSWMNSTAFVALYFTSSLYSIHLVNLSIATKMYSNPPLAFLGGPTWSSPQHANDQAGGMQIRLCAGTWACLANIWHPLHYLTSSFASFKAVGQYNLVWKLLPNMSLRLHGCCSNLSGFHLGFIFLFLLRHI